MADKDTTILDLQGVTKIYQRRGELFGPPAKAVVALNAVTLRIGKGEIFGLVGESGSGKTTVGRLIVRLERIDRGRILLDGIDVARLQGRALTAFRKRVQMIFQDPYQSLNPQRTIYETVSEPLGIHRMASGEERIARTARVLKSVGLSPPEDFLYRFPHRLSGGQRQRVAIARAMVVEPQMVVADEPTSMLDASISAQIFNILLEMRDSLGITILFITHSLAAARYLCDRIGVIYHGCLMEIGAAEALIEAPKHPYTQALMDAIPKFGQRASFVRFQTLLPREREGGSGTGCAFYSRCAKAVVGLCDKMAPTLTPWAAAHEVACHLNAEGKGLPPLP